MLITDERQLADEQCSTHGLVARMYLEQPVTASCAMPEYPAVPCQRVVCAAVY